MRVCIFRLSAIGDVCHMVAALHVLKKYQPNVRVTWIIGRVEYQLVQHIPDIEFIIFDKSLGLKAFYQLYKDMKGREFDILCHMQVALRANIASLCIRTKRRIGFDDLRAKEGHGFVVRERIRQQKEPHVMDGFRAFIENILNQTISADAMAWDFHAPEAELSLIDPVFTTTKKIFVICPAASKKERNWSAQNYAALADYAFAKGYAPVLCGGPSAMEQNLAQSICRFAKVPVKSVVGQTTLLQLLACLKRADLVLAPDTGPLHMAVSQQTPVIGLYAHSNPQRTGPYYYRDLTVSVYEDTVREQYGTSVDKLPWGKRAKGEHLMDLISQEQVKTAFDRAEALYIKAVSDNLTTTSTSEAE